ncbi:MerR family transcriptional regulator [Gemmobacter lutimaris]|uniref:MerR family transcriptional regulator n=1 Tax=Gemmobacter lutimaris TaxID=2306023 RepID=A0A398BZB5_9RHOB|nr:helix-turn-helix domain-containing protein [Gemmobacter lutimaris]RID93758.1 MerR family transcriptional regulator [Gemmobacter lutimaris]
MSDLTIGDVARESGIKINTIRFYEDRGLLPAPPRSAGNRRLYDPAAVARLRFIRHARELGFGLPAIADLLRLAGHPEAPCAAADAIARTQLAEVEARIRSLSALRAELQRMADCGAHSAADCRVLESLGDHSLCAGPHES